jgi:hypothetical protein
MGIGIVATSVPLAIVAHPVVGATAFAFGLALVTLAVLLSRFEGDSALQREIELPVSARFLLSPLNEVESSAKVQSLDAHRSRTAHA